jgi:EAL domain-containing protein (putative c-di-GMP-specific phosphodiesterase class I)
MQKEPDSYISTKIYKDFVLNNNLGVPTIIKEYEHLERALKEHQYLSCITVQINQLLKIESMYGSDLYNGLLIRITNLLKELWKEAFREEDIFVLDLMESDTFVLFLSAPRSNETKMLDHLEPITERVRVNLDKEIFRIFYPYLKEYSRPAIGYSLIIQNPMINNMRQITQLIQHAKEMGKFLSTKHDYQSRYTLQKIIIGQEIYSVFQPIVNMKTLDVIGYEALSRGPKDTEFASPLLLFIFAQNCGLSFELDRLCRKKAFVAIRDLKTDMKIFVNTLTMTIHDPEFRGIYLKELLEDLKIKPENVVFEVSEKLAIDNYDLFRGAMKDYTDIGIVHASDDIGTGHSDLERIMELNPGFMKIDISFVKDVDKSYIKQEIVKALVLLAKNIGSLVIAEGVETRAEYEKLMELNVDYGQGFLFAEPSETLTDVNRDF